MFWLIGTQNATNMARNGERNGNGNGNTDGSGEAWGNGSRKAYCYNNILYSLTMKGNENFVFQSN